MQDSSRTNEWGAFKKKKARYAKKIKKVRWINQNPCTTTAVKWVTLRVNACCQRRQTLPLVVRLYVVIDIDPSHSCVMNSALTDQVIQDKEIFWGVLQDFNGS